MITNYEFKNILKASLLSGITALGFASCDSDIDPVYVLPSEDTTLGGATGDIILTPDNPQALAMTIYWSGDGQLALSDTLLQAPVNAAEETIQLSKDEQFTGTIDLSVEKVSVPANSCARNLILFLGASAIQPMKKPLSIFASVPCFLRTWLRLIPRF